MKYYVTADVHGFYTPFKRSLREAGWFEDEGPKKLIILGDLFDRGNEAAALEDFILELMDKNLVILIRGNHEDLFETFVLRDLTRPLPYHISNGTVSTAGQLTENIPGGGFDAMGFNLAVYACKDTPYYRRIIPAAVDYYETGHYIFCHGWLPGVQLENRYSTFPDWRNADKEQWDRARWINGMDASRFFYEDKTVYCGHWHASYGHSKDGNGPEFGEGAVFTPYRGRNVVAMDACTAYSGFVNVEVLED